MDEKTRRDFTPEGRKDEAVCCLAGLIVWLFAEADAFSRTPVGLVSIPPQKGIVERIGGEDVQVSVMLPPGKVRKRIHRLLRKSGSWAGRKFIFPSGAFEERILPMVGESLPNLRVADMSRGITRRAMEEAHHHEGEDETEAHEHHRGELDPHVWMAPLLLAQAG
jgi:zinc transport system substrate-binding protein